MARTPAKEEMVIKSIYGPKRLLDRPALSEHIIKMLEEEYTGTKTTDPRKSTIQSTLDQLTSEDPKLKSEYRWNPIEVEEKIRLRFHERSCAAHETLDQMDAISEIIPTDSEIGEYMVSKGIS